MMLTHEREDHCGHVCLVGEPGKESLMYRGILGEQHVERDLNPGLLCTLTRMIKPWKL